MKDYTADDFISADITVSKLIGVTHSRASTWARPKRIPRTCDGILYFVSGSIEYYFGDETFTAKEGMVLKLPKGIPYNGKQLTDDHVEVIYCDFISGENELLDYPIPFVYYPSDGDSVRREFERIFEIWNRRTVCSALEAKNATADLLCSMAKDVAVNICGYGDRSRIIGICEYIRKNCCEADFGVSDAAKHFHISEAHLRRIFSSELHTSPIAYLASARIELAKERLVARTDKAISEIAEECGFANVYYFSGAFKRATGETPSNYRKRMTESGL